VLDGDDRTRGAVIRTLMCEGEVDLAEIATEHALEVAAEAYFAPELEALAKMPELATYDQARHKITTTPMGRLLVRNVCMVFDRYYQPTAGFSPTI
jgi:oxygen-independent coproporphyrinogen-3 oxidase